jgi:hypothetical protein
MHDISARELLAAAYRDNGDFGAAYCIAAGGDLLPDTQIALLAIREALSRPAGDGWRGQIEDGLKAFCASTPDFDMSSAMRRSAADFILGQPWPPTYSAGYAAGIEDAAKVAIGWWAQDKAKGLANTMFASINIATAIRALVPAAPSSNNGESE